MSFLLFSLLSIFAQVSAQQGPTAWTASPFNPPSLPLAVKSPYLNAWAPLGNNSAAVNNAWPRTQGTEMSVSNSSLFPAAVSPLTLLDRYWDGTRRFESTGPRTGCWVTSMSTTQASQHKKHFHFPQPKAHIFLIAEEKSQSTLHSSLRSRFVANSYCEHKHEPYLVRQATDLNRLSMPFSYLQIVVEPEDSNTHDVQVYADVSGGTFTRSHA